jgi:hypothetical protein
MYRAIGENAWRDGLFSHAAPNQSYQASVQQYADGSLGAIGRLASRAEMQRNHSLSQRRGRPVAPRHGLHGAYRDGSLGRLLLPQLTRQSMTGIGSSAYRDGSLGAAYRDGSLGLGATTTDPGAAPTLSLPPVTPTTINVGPSGITVLPTPPLPPPWYQNSMVKAVAIVGMGALVIGLIIKTEGR